MSRRSSQCRVGWLATAVVVIGCLVPAHLGSTPPADSVGPSTVPATATPSGLGWLHSDFEAVGDDYDPNRDPGSLFNVARAIGLRDRPATGAGVDIALIDTGVVNVPGLQESRIIRGPDFSFEDANPDFRTLDTNGHGTHLAGIIVADGSPADGDKGDEGHRRRTENRVVGIAPDARLISIKVGAADGSADVTQVIAAINWVIENRTADGLNIRVINLAYGTDSTQDYLADPLAHAVERAWRSGIVVVVAAGNDGSDHAALRNPAVDPYVIAVGAGRSRGWRSVEVESFTNPGTAERPLDILAPGRSIVSLRNPGSYSDAYNDTGRVDANLVRGTGTSQAAAVVTGAVAVLLEDRPWLTPDQVKGILIKSADGRTQPGFLDIGRALRTHPPRDGQMWPQSTGHGSIDLARGSLLITDLDGAALSGTDIFGTDWGETAWERDAWSENTWLGTVWAVDVWSNTSWSGWNWSEITWSGNEWSGNEWSSVGWLGNEWSGNEWSSVGSPGNEWSRRGWWTMPWSTKR